MIKLGLIGWPVSHSLSPILQNAALNSVGLPGDYHLFPIDPAQTSKLGDLAEMVRRGELTGLNVTIPYKQLIIPFLDELTPSAIRIGAVNTIYARSHRLIGHNTDAPGFEADLRNKAGNIMNKPGTALVLGAGGSARAVVSALKGMAWQVIIAARNLSQAEMLSSDLAKHIGNNTIEITLLDNNSIESLLGRVNLVVNTTPVGMVPNIDKSPWPAGLSFPTGAFIYDLIYNPPQTLFVRQAHEIGLQASNGLGMLVEQASLAFEIWTGKPASREVMYSAVYPKKLEE